VPNTSIISIVLILALDTATSSGSVAVLRDDRLIGVISTASDETYSSRMFRQLEFLIDELKISADAFDLFAVNIGPGSFTGLRVGLTAVKGWAETYGRPAVGISGLEAVAAQSRSAGLVVPMLDARRGEVYWGFYRREGSRLVREGDDRVTSPEEFLAQLDEARAKEVATAVSPDFGVFGVALGEVEQEIRRRGVACEAVSPALAPSIGQLARQRALRGETVDALTLDANYVRRSDAELHWKGRG
jgi:tRNA threonylcarbamoyladenosine biosynthesis protein TsaB